MIIFGRGAESLRTCLGFARSFPRQWGLLAGITVVGTLGAVAQLLIPVLSAQTINVAIQRQDKHALVLYSGLILLLSASAGALYLVEGLQLSRLRERASVHLEASLASKLLAQPLLFFRRYPVGYLASRMSHDGPEAVEAIITLASMGRVVGTAIGTLLLLPRFNLQLGALVLGLMPVYAWAMLRMGERAKGAFVEVSERTAKSASWLHEALAGVNEIKSCMAEREALLRLHRLGSARARSMVQARCISFMGDQLTQSMTLLVSMATVTYGGYLVIMGRMSLGGMVAMNALAGFLLMASGALIGKYLSLQRASAAIHRIDDLLRLPAPGFTGSLPGPLDPNAPLIEFRGVSYAFEGGERVLESVSFEVEKGEIVLIVGQNGSGKTTLLNLLLGHYRPTDGEILLGGQPLRKMASSAILSTVAYVPQEIFLFSDTILNNIRLGNRYMPEETLRNAIGLAGISDFIDDLPEGIDTQAGERGIRLSGGQRQRTALSRALAREVPILVLDEATASVDAVGETRLYEALRGLRGKRTIVVVAHHYSALLEFVDRVYILREGRLIALEAHLPANQADEVGQPISVTE